ncbi:hypothetical protein [Nostoc sp. FACHB-280]|uniref:hypothetical protein n=1 Tax=Nostoc sp. FACHB-280 TaxID=2692839 RepID=UPI00168A5D01|nr:hypothetical protein [Nostoc sp. FACHB-280]MBD2495804.1 hypothetical protein [Nostoc sp. FACHB-280]
MYISLKKIPQWWQPPGELVIRVHLPITCSVATALEPDKILLILGNQAKKNPPVGINQLGELVIRVHLPITCSVATVLEPDKILLILGNQAKKIPQLV